VDAFGASFFPTTASTNTMASSFPTKRPIPLVGFDDNPSLRTKIRKTEGKIEEKTEGTIEEKTEGKTEGKIVGKVEQLGSETIKPKPNENENIPDGKFRPIAWLGQHAYHPVSSIINCNINQRKPHSRSCSRISSNLRHSPN
jgi:hypothetical protein